MGGGKKTVPGRTGDGIRNRSPAGTGGAESAESRTKGVAHQTGHPGPGSQRMGRLQGAPGDPEAQGFPEAPEAQGDGSHEAAAGLHAVASPQAPAARHARPGSGSKSRVAFTQGIAVS